MAIHGVNILTERISTIKGMLLVFEISLVEGTYKGLPKYKNHENA